MTRGDDDLYTLLGVRPDASPGQISQAYRALLRRYHPDLRSGRPAAVTADRDVTADQDDERLRRVMAAYDVLHDPRRRADYDNRRAPGPPGRGGRPGSRPGPAGGDAPAPRRAVRDVPLIVVGPPCVVVGPAETDPAIVVGPPLVIGPTVRAGHLP